MMDSKRWFFLQITWRRNCFSPSSPAAAKAYSKSPWSWTDTWQTLFFPSQPWFLLSDTRESLARLIITKHTQVYKHTLTCTSLVATTVLAAHLYVTERRPNMCLCLNAVLQLVGASQWLLVQILPSGTRGIVILTVIHISINQDWRFGTWIRNGPDCLRVLKLFCFIWPSASHSQMPTLDRVISEPGPQPAAVSSHPTNHCSGFSSDILTSLLPPPLV